MADAPVIVVGAGIAGLTCALALARSGRPVTLIEKRTHLEEVGAGLQLSPNASRVLIDLGLGKALMRAACAPLSLDVVLGRSGQRLARAPLADAMMARYNAPYLVIHRADLQQILLDHVRGLGVIPIHVGRTPQHIEQDEHGVTLTMTNQQGDLEHLNGQALVGADGLHSSVAGLLGDPSQARPAGYQAWRGKVPMRAVPQHLETNRTTLWLGREGHAVTYPLQGGQSFNLVVVTREKSAEQGWSREGQTDVLRARLRHWSPLLPLIEAMQSFKIWTLYDRPPRPRWNKGRCVLIGDAVHPVLPFLAQGAALAIEDAASLSLCLTRYPDQPAEAFATLSRIRHVRAERVQQQARRNGQIYHLPWPLSLARDRVIAQKGAGLMEDYDWLYGWSLVGKAALTPPAL
jgi:salicylate hydroxylase